MSPTRNWKKISSTQSLITSILDAKNSRQEKPDGVSPNGGVASGSLGSHGSSGPPGDGANTRGDSGGSRPSSHMHRVVIGNIRVKRRRLVCCCVSVVSSQCCVMDLKSHCQQRDPWWWGGSYGGGPRCDARAGYFRMGPPALGVRPCHGRSLPAVSEKEVRYERTPRVIIIIKFSLLSDGINLSWFACITLGNVAEHNLRPRRQSQWDTSICSIGLTHHPQKSFVYDSPLPLSPSPDEVQ